MTFAERYGSFSSEGNYVNIIDLTPMITERYRRELEALVARERTKSPSSAFSSTQTQVIRADVQLANDAATRGTVQVTTQRTSRENGAERTFAQVLDLDVLKTSGGWLVDRGVWEPVRS